MKTRAFVDFAFRPYPAAMSMDDALDNGQAYPCAFIFVGAVKTLKNTEQLVMVLHVKADTIVPDIVHILCSSSYPPTSMSGTSRTL